jgi:DNA repair photolyase
MPENVHTHPGRGARSNQESRFLALRRVAEPCEEFIDPDLPPRRPGTELRRESPRTILTRNQSPDVPFEVSINAYRGCEHGCVYCYARITHSYLDLSPGLDFETKLVVKEHAAETLVRELSAPGYRVSPIALGTNTDPYQPVEREQRVTRSILETLLRFNHPVTIVTKGALVLRDLDLLTRFAERNLVAVFLSVTTLDAALKRTLEPRAASPAARLRALAALAAAGVPTGVLVAPVIPAVTDMELEGILEAARAVNVRYAGYLLLRLPREVRDLFEEWCKAELPLRAQHVQSLIRSTHFGADYDARFGHRMKGDGPYAQAIAARFALACRKLKFDSRNSLKLDTSQFRVPSAQLDLL